VEKARVAAPLLHAGFGPDLRAVGRWRDRRPDGGRPLAP
jgi:hypothetical protein